jgi:hypothetical protein
VSDFEDLLRVVVDMRHTIAELQHQSANMLRVGTIQKVDGKKGYQVDFGPGDDGKPIPSPWFPHPEKGGKLKSWHPLTEGQIVYAVAPSGDPRQAFLVPRGGFSDANPQPSEKLDENVETYGKFRREVRSGDTLEKVGKSKRTATEDGKITEDTGDQPEGGGAPGGLGGNVQHELNRQLQGIRAILTQHDNHIAGLHEAASKMRQIAEFQIPGLKTLIPILNGDPQSLERAAQAALGNLEGYVAKTFQQAIGKLTNGFMNNALGLVRGFVSGQIGGLLDQVSALALEHGVGGQIADALDEARGLIDAAAAGDGEAMAGQLAGMAGAFAGTPGEAAFGLLRGQIGGTLAAAADIAGNLGGLLDGQQNLVKGLTRSYRLGGY